MSASFANIAKDFDYKLIDKLRKQLGQDDRVVKVGVPVSAEPEPDGTPMVLVAAVHEFGSPKNAIPERSFIRSAVSENTEQYRRLNRINFVALLKGSINVETALKRLGEMAKSHMQQKIRSGPFQELKPETIARKGSSRPLIDTGNLIQSITYEIGKKND